ncbi:MAG: phytoene/squalene synthase family protein [Bryobacterales bacterium]|nr:phytoene/squalene synthase family protein [Bryobacteraceae bacterium]MDW8353972.1 phytoene/squalene synthase family protein [Bryobacterales bacterium]
MKDSVAQSYAWCRRLARRRARNFYYSFWLLPSPQRDAVCALYAFMRRCDDLTDEPGADAAAALAAWRRDMEQALEGRSPPGPLWPAFADTVRRYRIPRHYFYEVLEGVAGDLRPRRMATFEELYRYCYQVASVPGLSLVHVLGFESAQALALAEKCGVAFQLTNILRDVREDALRGRIYLPEEDLAHAGARAEDVLAGRRTPAVVEVLRRQAVRAAWYYRESAPLIGAVAPEGRAALWALIAIYRKLLERIERSDFDVMARRIRLPAWEKSWIVAQAMWGRQWQRSGGSWANTGRGAGAP